MKGMAASERYEVPEGQGGEEGRQAGREGE